MALDENPVRTFTHTAANATAANRTLNKGEVGFESDTGRMKIGDGSTAWADLGYTYTDGWIHKVKTSTTTRTATTTLAADPTLTFTAAASTNYMVQIVAFFDTVAAADFKFSLSGPASPTLVRISRTHIDPTNLTTAVVASEVAYTASTAVAAGTGTTGGYIRFDILIQNGTTAGAVDFNWAQNTSDAGNTSVLLGSFLRYRIVAA